MLPVDRRQEEGDGSSSDGDGSEDSLHMVGLPDSCDWPAAENALSNPVVPGCCLCLLVLLGLLASASLDAVPPLHLGIKYNNFAKSADTTTTYEPGRYLLGPFSKFLIFPATTRTFEFASLPSLTVGGRRFSPLHTRTKEGLALHLQVSVQYLLRKDHLGKLYSTFNMLYEDVFIRTVRDSLIKAASEYEAWQLWEERTKFGNKMQEMVNQSLWDLDAECWGLQLLLVDLPDNYEHRLTQTQVQNQLMRTRSMEQLTARIRAETDVIQADFARTEKVILAHGQANYTVTTKEAQALAQQRTIDVEAEVMQHLALNLGILLEDLVTYQKFGAMDDKESSRFFYGFQGSSPMLVQSSP